MKDVTAPVLEKAEIATYNTVILTFNEEIADLTGDEVVKTTFGKKDITTDNKATLTNEGTNAIKVTYEKALSAGDYTFTIYGIKDIAANGITEAAPLTAKETKEASKITKIDFKTQTLADSYTYESSTSDGIYERAAAADVTAITPKDVDVYFNTTDQYNQVMALTSQALDKVTAEAKIGSYPLTVKDITSTDGAGKLTIKADKAIKAGATLNLTLTAKNADDTVLVSESKNFAIEKNFETDIAADIKGLNADKTALDPEKNNTVKLTADLANKNGNPVAAAEIKWVISDKNIVSFKNDATTATDESKLDNLIVSGKKDITLDVKSKGDVTVTAYLTTDTTKSKSVTLHVTDTALTNLNNVEIPTGDLYNQEDLTFGLTANTGAELKADQVHYVVATKPEGAQDPEVTLVQDADTPNKVNAIVKTSTKGNYKLTFYVGSTLEDTETVKADAPFETKINPNVETIECENVEQLPIGGAEIKKAIVFKNKHGEQVDVKKSALKVENTDGVTVHYYGVDDAQVDSTPSAFVKSIGLSFSSDAEANIDKEYVVTLASGTSKQLRLEGKLVAKATLSKVTFADNTKELEVINRDTYDKDADSDKDTDDIIVDATSGKAYQLIKVDFEDQYGNPSNQTAETLNGLKTLTGTGASKYSLKYYDKDKNELTGRASGAVAYIGVHANDTTETPANATLTIYNKASGEGKKALAELTLSAKDARTITTVDLDKKEASALTSKAVKFKLDAKDQYGAPVSVSAVAAKDVAAARAAGITVSNVANEADGSQTFTVTGTKAGTYDVDVTVTGSDTKTKDISVKLTVKDTQDIESIKILPTLETADEKKYDTSKYQVQANNDTDHKYNLSFQAMDKDGNVVDVPSNYVSYSLVSVQDSEGKNVLTNTVTATTLFDFGTDFVNLKNNAAWKDGCKVTIKATAANSKEATLTFTVGVSEPAIQAGTQYIVDKSKADDKQVAITDFTTYNDPAKNQIGVNGIDQYGQVQNVNGVKFYSENPDIATIDESTGKITPVNVGEASIKVNIGNDTKYVKVHVTASTVAALTKNGLTLKKVNVTGLKWELDTTTHKPKVDVTSASFGGSIMNQAGDEQNTSVSTTEVTNVNISDTAHVTGTVKVTMSDAASTVFTVDNVELTGITKIDLNNDTSPTKLLGSNYVPAVNATATSGKSASDVKFVDKTKAFADGVVSGDTVPGTLTANSKTIAVNWKVDLSSSGVSSGNVDLSLAEALDDNVFDKIPDASNLKMATQDIYTTPASAPTATTGQTIEATVDDSTKKELEITNVDELEANDATFEYSVDNGENWNALTGDAGQTKLSATLASEATLGTTKVLIRKKIVSSGTHTLPSASVEVLMAVTGRA